MTLYGIPTRSGPGTTGPLIRCRRPQAVGRRRSSRPQLGHRPRPNLLTGTANFAPFVPAVSTSVAPSVRFGRRAFLGARRCEPEPVCCAGGRVRSGWRMMRRFGMPTAPLEPSSWSPHWG